jgi:predicted metalloendopeptidase
MKFSWTNLISEGIYKSFGNDLTIHVNETVLVDDWSYLESATQIYKEYNATRRRDLDNLLIWKFVKEKVGLLSKNFKNIKQDYDKVLKGTNELPSSTLTCSNYVIDFMEYAVGRVYVDKYFNGESKESVIIWVLSRNLLTIVECIFFVKAVEMIENILNEFKVILSESDWMDEESKLNALAKVSNIDTKIGYPESIKNDTYLNELYDDVSDIF